MMLATGIMYSFGRFAKNEDDTTNFGRLSLTPPVAFDAFDEVRTALVVPKGEPQVRILMTITHLPI